MAEHRIAITIRIVCRFHDNPLVSPGDDNLKGILVTSMVPSVGRVAGLLSVGRVAGLLDGAENSAAGPFPWAIPASLAARRRNGTPLLPRVIGFAAPDMPPVP